MYKVKSRHSSVSDDPQYALYFANGADEPPANVTIARASTGTYFDATGTRQTASSNVARLDHDPSTLAPRGLLVEESATNHFLNSGSPATQTSASLTTGIYTLWMEGTGSVAVAGNTATITGAGTATAGAPVVFEVTGAGTVDYTVSASPTLVQAEDSIGPTSYIATTGSAATRAEDIPDLSSISMINAAEGTIVVEWEASIPLGVGSGRVFEMSTDPNNSIAVHGSGTAGQFFTRVYDGGVQQFLSSTYTSTESTIQRIAVAYKAGEYGVSMDGGVISSGAGSVPSFDDFSLGNRKSGARALNGWVRAVQYYQTRAPDALLRQYSS